MQITEADWQQVDKPSSDMSGWRVIASDNGTSGTIEEICFNTDFNSVLRRRWWPKSSVMAAGEVWFKYIG